MPDVSEFAVAYNAGIAAQAAASGILRDMNLALVPDGMSVEDLERFLPEPRRIKKDVRLMSVPSFCEYVNKFKTPETVLFGNRGQGHVEAALDYHDTGTPSWCDHTCGLHLAHSLEWASWKARNTKAQTQAEFGVFLDDRIDDIITPGIRQCVLSLEIASSAEFKSATRLQDGTVEFRYEEKHAGKGGGTVDLPEVFRLKIPVFSEGPTYELTAKLRYKLTAGVLTFHYVLVNPENVEREAFNAVLSELETETGITPLL